MCSSARRTWVITISPSFTVSSCASCASFMQCCGDRALKNLSCSVQWAAGEQCAPRRATTLAHRALRTFISASAATTTSGIGRDPGGFDSTRSGFAGAWAPAAVGPDADDDGRATDWRRLGAREEERDSVEARRPCLLTGVRICTSARELGRGIARESVRADVITAAVVSVGDKKKKMQRGCNRSSRDRFES